jgi:hypothetical protein
MTQGHTTVEEEKEAVMKNLQPGASGSPRDHIIALRTDSLTYN